MSYRRIIRYARLSALLLCARLRGTATGAWPELIELPAANLDYDRIPTWTLPDFSSMHQALLALIQILFVAIILSPSF